MKLSTYLRRSDSSALNLCFEWTWYEGQKTIHITSHHFMRVQYLISLMNVSVCWFMVEYDQYYCNITRLWRCIIFAMWCSTYVVSIVFYSSIVLCFLNVYMGIISLVKSREIHCIKHFGNNLVHHLMNYRIDLNFALSHTSPTNSSVTFSSFLLLFFLVYSICFTSIH